MAVDNKQIATDVLELVGGAENVAVATNCMTRLRLTLKDNSKADVEKIKKVKGVLGCQFAGSQLQVIIGQNVPKVLAEFVAMSGVKQGAAVDENLDAPKEKFELKNLPNIILDYLSGSGPRSDHARRSLRYRSDLHVPLYHPVRGHVYLYPHLPGLCRC